MRHGKAEPPHRTDFDRELTEAGRRRIAEAANGLKQLLGQRAIAIWTSPLPRAKQTAEIVASTLGVGDIREHEAIYSGDLERLILATAEIPEDTTLVIIGHEPCLSAWSERISGVMLPFKLGAVACYKIKYRQPLLGKLRWFALAKMLATWGGSGQNLTE